jgi:hypothetical protein
MEGENSQDRGMPLSRQFVRRSSDSRNLRLARDLPLNRRVSVGARKIFVVKQTSHLPATNAAAGKTVQRILIFDDHPDSLRLVFGRRVASYVRLSDPQRTTSWGVALLWILVVGLMMAMFWPHF